MKYKNENEVDSPVLEINEKAGNYHYRTSGSRKKKMHPQILKLLHSTLVLRESAFWKSFASYAVIIFGFIFLGYFLYFIFQKGVEIHLESIQNLLLEPAFYVFVLAGFFAQLIDGSLGMGYGVTSASILLSAEIPPAAISGSIHTAEIFASGASGYAHYKFGNVNKKLFKTLVIPGVLGAFLGALLLVFLSDHYTFLMRCLMATYTLFLGTKFILNAFRSEIRKKKVKRAGWLAATGGFLDSFGGGGWGPVVTSTLVAKGRNIKYVVGSVSLTEFFVTLTSALTFFTLLGLNHWNVILGLILGSFIAAPLGAKMTGIFPRKTSFLLLGILVIIWSIRILFKLF